MFNTNDLHSLVSVRRAETSDCPSIMAMIEALARFHGDVARITLPRLKDDLFGQAPWLIGLVAEDKSSLVGYALLCRLCREQFGERGLDLHHLFVTDHARGRGIGRRIVEAAMDEARKMDCSYFVVGTNAENHGAQHFYQTMGFSLTSKGGPRYKLELTSSNYSEA